MPPRVYTRNKIGNYKGGVFLIGRKKYPDEVKEGVKEYLKGRKSIVE